jgi:hypothetical protein
MKIAGLVEVAGTLSVYPLVDFTIPRAEKEARYQVAEEEGRTTKSWKRIDDVYSEAAGKGGRGRR